MPRTGVLRNAGFPDGVWLFFENSTGCLISQCQIVLYPGLVRLSGLAGWDSFGNTFVVRIFSDFCWRV
jgi:hypothetical protein